MRKTVVINAVGLTPRVIGQHTPRINELLARGKIAGIQPAFPAVTCTAQTTYLTGALPSAHGIVANGWYFQETSDVRFWLQADGLVQRPRVWDLAKARDPAFTSANICWWYAMYSGADYTVTPRPIYTADGRKIPDLWTQPAELRFELQAQLGPFPLFQFWGPGTSIKSTRWIADAAIAVDKKFDPTLSLVYLPHLDYNFQRFGPGDPRCARDVTELDTEVGKLVHHFAAHDAAILLLSEYGIVPVSRPVHINRILRNLNLLSLRNELGREMLDAGDSQAFAVADHQVAHVYVNHPAVMPLVVRELKATPGIAHVYLADARRIADLEHPRSGEVIAVAETDSWFTYYWWLDDARAPDFARTVDIHRKPGYDPCELFIDPKIPFPKLKIAWALFKRRLGLRSLMQVVPLDAALVRGSHGAHTPDPRDGPVLITSAADLLDAESIAATDVRDLILHHVFS